MRESKFLSVSGREAATTKGSRFARSEYALSPVFAVVVALNDIRGADMIAVQW
jgi:hypothetical protein